MLFAIGLDQLIIVLDSRKYPSPLCVHLNHHRLYTEGDFFLPSIGGSAAPLSVISVIQYNRCALCVQSSGETDRDAWMDGLKAS